MKRLIWMLMLCVATGVAMAQDAPASTPQDAAQPPPAKGTVLFQSQGPPPEGVADPNRIVLAPELQPSGPELTDVERSALTTTAYDLDARITPVGSGLAMRARVTLRNDGVAPLNRLALQISSTLIWESATLVSVGRTQKLDFAQHLLDTDADHSGKANEVVIALPQPLAVGKTVELDLFYSGAIAADGGRLERIGASHEQALKTDWDAIGEATALRGFGDVLWYPVASRQLFLGDGAQLFDAVGAAKLQGLATKVRLRLTVAYKGEPPVAAYFCGRRQVLAAIADDPGLPISEGSGLATAEFAEELLGFRVASLFVVQEAESLIANSDAAGGAALLAVESEDEKALPALAAAALNVAPMLQEWLGPKPLSALTVIDHGGEPFEDGPLLVGPVSVLAASTSAQALVHSLTHAWVQTGQPWMDEGLAQFFALLWTEREQGREVAIAQLGELMKPVSLAEPEIDPSASREKSAPGGELAGQVVGQPLISTSSELFYRRKAAAVWWMLRGIVGDEALQDALQQWRERPAAKTNAEQDALAFESMLERAGPKNSVNPMDLHWFFDAWVLHDRGLPDLTITDVTPRLLPSGQGHNAGWLVSVTVRNDGAAAAEVPVTIRSATFSTTSRVRVAGFATATARVIVEAQPAEVLVNDGSVPEVRASVHKVDLNVKQQ